MLAKLRTEITKEHRIDFLENQLCHVKTNRNEFFNYTVYNSKN